MNYRRPGMFSNMPPVVKNLLIINVLVFFGVEILKSTYGIDLTQHLALYYFESEFFRPHQYVTYMFMHGGFSHIFFNMFALWMFGKVLESVWGSKRFLIFYMVTGIGAALVHTFVNYLGFSSLDADFQSLIINPDPEAFAIFVRDNISHPSNELLAFVDTWSSNPTNTNLIEQAREIAKQIVTLNIDVPTVGASGAVFGILLAFGMLFPNTKLMLLFPPIPIKAKYFVIGYGAIELYMGVTGTADGIAHFAHLGGMLFGFILIKYWNKNNINRWN